eukprot:CAMPEP_0194272510 /NCGR_PEP_ID=MMETSP0169-20130528/6071_1 /TAXON_ID=218684 /ORGANISM="Corethron pennatum, Strain L29A3" /LENGTH=102 /DNA_ID=CAMNT_0039015201 /DNA_START=681 /DNA_END=989 /DNA_ORIENTATION=-
MKKCGTKQNSKGQQEKNPEAGGSTEGGSRTWDGTTRGANHTVPTDRKAAQEIVGLRKNHGTEQRRMRTCDRRRNVRRRRRRTHGGVAGREGPPPEVRNGKVS